MSRQFQVAGVIGFLAFFYGLYSAIFQSNPFAFTPLTIGGTLLFGYLNHTLHNKSILDLWKKSSSKAYALYTIYFVFGAVLELFARFFLHYWTYHPALYGFNEVFHVFFVAWPFFFFMTYEIYILIKGWLKSWLAAWIFATAVTEIIFEVPNLYVYAWRYTIPYSIIIPGWIILIPMPVLARKYLKI